MGVGEIVSQRSYWGLKDWYELPVDDAKQGKKIGSDHEPVGLLANTPQYFLRIGFYIKNIFFPNYFRRI